MFTIPGIRVHDALEWMFTFGWNLRSRCPGIRTIIPPQLKALDRWVLGPCLTSIRKIDGKVVSSKDKTAWMPYTLAADIFLCGDIPTIGLVAGEGFSFVRGSLPEFIHNPGVIWKWHPTFALRHRDEICFMYFGGKLQTRFGYFPENKIGRDMSFGFDGLAAPMIGRAVGIMNTDPAPFSWKRLPTQHRSIMEELQAQLTGTENHVKALRQKIAELKQCAHQKK